MKLRKRYIIPIVVLVLVAGAWLAARWRLNRPEYRARRLVAELRCEEPGLAESLLIKVGLADDGVRMSEDVLADLSALGPMAVPYILQAYIAMREHVGSHEGMDYEGYPYSKALARIGPDAIPRLTAGTRSADMDVRHMCVEALGLLGPEAAPAAGRIVEIVLDEQEDEFLRAAAARALGEIGPVHPDVAAALVRALGDRSPFLRGPAAVAIAQIGPPAKAAVGLLIGDLQDMPAEYRGDIVMPSPVTTIRALAAIGPAAREAGPVLHAIARGNDEVLREEAQIALKKIEAQAAIQPAGER